MRLRSAVDQEIRDLIQKNGRITFAQFMQVCLYSHRGGFYSCRDNRISTHFGTSPTSHPVFGALIARQLEQMWRLLGEPAVFHLIEVGSGDGALARSIVDACWLMESPFAQALGYVAADYQPSWLHPPEHALGWGYGSDRSADPEREANITGIQRVKAEGLRPFQNVVGCILCNELVDNFPVHRFAIQDGKVKEVFVTLEGENLTEVLDEPSSPRIENRLTGLGLPLPEGHRGEVNLAMDDWTSQLAGTLDRGFVLTIDYGELPTDLYSSQNSQGTLVCYNKHAVSGDPYQDIGQQDITAHVDFTSLMRLGDRQGLATVEYAQQSQFLAHLGFSSFLHELQEQDMSAARMELARMAMMTLVDPDEYGGFKVLAQAKGVGAGVELFGFENRGP